MGVRVCCDNHNAYLVYQYTFFNTYRINGIKHDAGSSVTRDVKNG